MLVRVEIFMAPVMISRQYEEYLSSVLFSQDDKTLNCILRRHNTILPKQVHNELEMEKSRDVGLQHHKKPRVAVLRTLWFFLESWIL
jgi:hypothetical protein